jgi:hypothetical protein
MPTLTKLKVDGEHTKLDPGAALTQASLDDDKAVYSACGLSVMMLRLKSVSGPLFCGALRAYKEVACTGSSPP